MGRATRWVLPKPHSPCRVHRRPEEPCPLLPALLASCRGPSRLTDGGVGPGLSLSQPALLSGRRPQASDPDPRGDAGLGGPGFRRAARIPLCGQHCKSSRAAAATAAGSIGTGWEAARGSTAAEPSWARRPRRAHISPPGVAGAEGPGGDRQGAQSPTLGGRGRVERAGPGRAGRGHSPPRRPPSPGPAGMHQQLMESNSASTGASHWLLRAFNPASLSSQSFMR